MPEQTMIERMARVCAAWKDEPDAWPQYRGLARLLLAQWLASNEADDQAGITPEPPRPV